MMLTKRMSLFHTSLVKRQGNVNNKMLTRQLKPDTEIHHICANWVCHRLQPANTRDSPRIWIEPYVMHTIWWHSIDY